MANRVTWTGFWINVILTAFKLFAGLIGNSGAMIADAMHSLSDFATDIVVLVSFRVVGRPADRDHSYGHGKYETLATAIIGSALALVGIGIFRAGFLEILAFSRGERLNSPGIIALIAAIVSIIVKERLYRYTEKVGRSIRSQAIIANAWHHRSDAFSSIGTFLGIGGAILLGKKWRILDPIAAIIVSWFIVKTAFKILSGSIKELVEGSLDENTNREIVSIVSGFHMVTDPHNLRTRRVGNKIAIEIHIRVPSDMHVSDAHAITSNIEEKIRDKFGESTFVNIHIEPGSA